MEQLLHNVYGRLFPTQAGETFLRPAVVTSM